MKRKKALSLFFLGILLTSLALPQQARAQELAPFHLTVNGQTVNLQPGLETKSGLITLPLGPVINAMGGLIYQNPSTGAVTAQKGTNSLTVQTGNPWYAADSQSLQSPVAPYWSQGRLYVPAAILSKAFPIQVGWDETTQSLRLDQQNSFSLGGAMTGVKPVDYSSLQKQIGTYLANRPGTYGIFLQDLVTGSVMSLNEDMVYTAASTYKLPETLLLYKLAAEGKVDLNQRLTYTKEFYEQGTGTIQSEPFGSTYTLRELARRNIEYSDNVAKNMIKHFLGRETVIQFMQSLGGQNLPITSNITSPRDMAKYLLAYREFLNQNPAYGWELRGYLQNTVFNDRIPRYLPAWVQVAHKIGSNNTFFHDVGIVAHPQHPYVLVLMSKDVNEKEGVESLAQLSKIIWNYQSSH